MRLGSPHTPKYHSVGDQFPLIWPPLQMILVHIIALFACLLPVACLQKAETFLAKYTQPYMQLIDITFQYFVCKTAAVVELLP